jgi:hypothetical protein
VKSKGELLSSISIANSNSDELLSSLTINHHNSIVSGIKIRNAGFENLNSKITVFGLAKKDLPSSITSKNKIDLS